MYQLEIQSGKRKGTRLRLGKKDYTLGRDEECSIRLATQDVSRRHCQIRSTDEGLFVSDLGSQNGTFVNEEQLTEEKKLKHGDSLRIGPIQFRILSGKKANALSKSALDTSDDDIMSWLADGDQEDEPSAGDTTVISSKAATSDTVAGKKNAPSPAGDQVPPPAKQQFDSIADEAADIIRRHQEMIRDKKLDR